jgi:exodeoxyribonuclease VII small subunit
VESSELSDLTFEDAFRQLEETVAMLESGGLTIDDLVSRFEEGMTLVALCRRRLDAAQARISRLVRDDPFVISEMDLEVEIAEV